jgi:hypothetical protein
LQTGGFPTGKTPGEADRAFSFPPPAAKSAPAGRSLPIARSFYNFFSHGSLLFLFIRQPLTRSKIYCEVEEAGKP